MGVAMVASNLDAWRYMSSERSEASGRIEQYVHASLPIEMRVFRDQPMRSPELRVYHSEVYHEPAVLLAALEDWGKAAGEMLTELVAAAVDLSG